MDSWDDRISVLKINQQCYSVFNGTLLALLECFADGSPQELDNNYNSHRQRVGLRIVFDCSQDCFPWEERRWEILHLSLVFGAPFKIRDSWKLNYVHRQHWGLLLSARNVNSHNIFYIPEKRGSSIKILYGDSLTNCGRVVLGRILSHLEHQK